MSSRKIGMFAAIAAFAAFPGAAFGQAQQQPAQPDSAAIAEVQGWLAELQTIGAKLQQLHAQALQDQALSAEQEALGERIQSAMQAADPSLQASLQRAEAIQGEAQAAQAAGDQARLAALGAELEQIEVKFMTAQEQVMSDPQINADVEAFQARLTARVTALDPEAPALIARMEVLQRQLAATLGGS